MLRSIGPLCLVVALAAGPLAAGTLAAQARPTGVWARQSSSHDGAFLSAGGGLGAAHVSCTGCATLGHELSPSFWVKAGGAVSPKFLIGAEIDAWYAMVSGNRTIIANGSLTGYYYPNPTSGLFFKGGLGPSIYQVRNGSTFKGVGIGAVLGVGYDYRIGRSLYLTPVASLQVGKPGNLTKTKGAGGPLPGGAGTPISGKTWAKDVKTNVISLGISLTYAD
jgi:hypothetical protein